MSNMAALQDGIAPGDLLRFQPWGGNSRIEVDVMKNNISMVSDDYLLEFVDHAMKRDLNNWIEFDELHHFLMVELKKPTSYIEATREDVYCRCAIGAQRILAPQSTSSSSANVESADAEVKVNVVSTGKVKGEGKGKGKEKEKR